MKLKTLIIENFRSYKEEIRIEMSDFTAFIGVNDAGKSTILEAMEIFFNNEVVKIDSSDYCVHSGSKLVQIGCIFTDVPERIVIDSTSTTSLSQEYLLNNDGNLEIHKLYDCSIKSPKESVNIKCIHPTKTQLNDLLQLKISDLKKRMKELSVDENHIDLRSSSSIRKAIFNHFDGQLQLSERNIPLNKEDGKSIWETLSLKLPIFALFQADRPSKDDDSEVQDPMKLAITEAIRQVETEINQIVGEIKRNVEEVATRTLQHLQGFDPALANELLPQFKNDPKWDSLFKLTLTGDNSIPINKRGSGVRRLILLSFFKAEVERKRGQSAVPVIYAIEEPETSQHPSNQLKIIKTLLELSNEDNCQVLITTHVPALAGEIPIESLRYITVDPVGRKVVLEKTEFVFDQVASALGITPDISKPVPPVIICVEGSNDVNFLRHISKVIHQKDNSLPDLTLDPRLTVLPLGGSTLADWVKHRYLKNLGAIEIHIYDRDYEPPAEPKYLFSANSVNQRQDGSIAFITSKKELENYIHPECIKNIMGLDITFGDFDDVPKMLRDIGEMGESKIKKWLNDQVAATMTYEHLCAIDKEMEIESWFIEISKRLNRGMLIAEVAASTEII
ncbi:AAA family ATPase [Paenibacillus sp. LMG 31456]|uniref:AAA family ATPase n=1 Tax=Paenibacillus foliorum TaxID=2654974 RepID=A0A972K2I0_9BACL|nr:ATP-binding protein [Paenibacillus foliorum]NOU95920.1 AAA family ATPase [Paenibacillus foliorum]